jgi:uncharacterized membrane protein YfcA
VDPIDAALVSGGGVIAGVVNAMAGGGSLLTVPLLTLAGLPGGVANGTNRIGIWVQNVGSALSFRREGVSGVAHSGPVMLPVLAGSLIGAVVVSQLADDTFERLFGFLMIPLLILSLRPPRARWARRRPPSSVGAAASQPAAEDRAVTPWPRWLSVAVFFAIGLYGGAFQAGVGLIITLALARSGIDLVLANAIKVIVLLALTTVAVPVFILQGQVDWPFAGVLAVGYGIGGVLGARIAVRGGEKVIRPVLIGAVVALALRMIGVW